MERVYSSTRHIYYCWACATCIFRPVLGDLDCKKHGFETSEMLFTIKLLDLISLGCVAFQLLVCIYRLKASETLDAVDKRDAGPAISDEGSGIAHEIIANVGSRCCEPRNRESTLGVSDQFQRYFIISDLIISTSFSQQGGHKPRSVFYSDLNGF